MKVQIGRWPNAAKFGTVNVSYVWDREDKYLVLTDDENKKKYSANTYFGSFSELDVYTLLDSYARNVLQLDEQTIQGLEYCSKGKPNKACHNDDFRENYKKGYTFIPFATSGLGY